jgi:Fis family transcriptional regulator, factor for inversion stimulation protein
MNEKFDGLVQYLLSGNIYLQQAIELLERSMIERALQTSDGNRSEASKQLGIHRNTLQKKLLIYGLGAGRARRKPPKRYRRSPKPKAGAA